MSEKKKHNIAAAVKYDVENDDTPQIVASGKGAMADEIIKIAEENDVPLYKDPHLVKLLESLEVETDIPQELYVLVAEVLSFVYKLERMKQKKKTIVKKMNEIKK
jgi:flagellar biosynthesis protein